MICTAESETRVAGSWRLWTWVCLAALLLGALANTAYLAYNCPLDLSGDEAHYWDWTRHLDWSYYCKGPLVAYILAGSRAMLADWSVHVVGSEALAVRLPAIVLSVLTGLGIFALARMLTGSPAVALTAVGLTFTVPIFVAGSIIMTIDAPQICAWTWCLVCTARALRTDRLGWWVAAGLLLAVGILAKLMMVLLPMAVAAALLATSSSRRRFASPGPYIAAAVGLLGFVPIVVWNILRGWVTFRHMAGQAGLTSRFAIDLTGVLSYVFGQLLVVNPVWFVMLVVAVVAYWRDRRQETVRQDELLRLTVFATIVPWAVFLAFSPITKIQPNWPVAGLVTGIVLVARWLVMRLQQTDTSGRRRIMGFLVTGVVIGGAATIASHRSDLLMPLFIRLARNAPPWELTPTASYDPASRLRGWAQLGHEVGQVLEAERAAGREPFIVTDNYMVTGEIAFYCPGNPQVYCIQSALGDRMCQYDLWPNPLDQPDLFVGRPCIYVGALRPALTGQSGPGAMPGLRTERIVEHRVAGERVRSSAIFVCDAYRGFGLAPRSTQRY